MIKKILYILFLFFISAEISFAQQDPQYSQYMFNQLVINPAYAGSKEAKTIKAAAELWENSTRIPKPFPDDLHEAHV